MKDEVRLTNLDSKEVKENENYDLRTRRVLANFKEDLEFWSFLRKNLDTLGTIKDWSIYRRASQVSIKPFTRVTSTRNFNYRDDDGRRWMASSLEIAGHREELVYSIITPSERIVTPTKGRHWRYSEELLQQLIKDNKIWFGRDGDTPRLKTYLEKDPQKKDPIG